MPTAAAAFPYQLAATDLDGTLLGPHKEISVENLAAVRALQAHGARVVLASGRRHQNSIRFYRQVGLDTLLISCSGALIKDPQTDATLREKPLLPATAAELVSRGQAEGYTTIYYHRNHLYIAARDHWTDLYESRVAEKAEIFPGNLENLRGEAALKIVWYGDPEKIKSVRAQLERQYQGRAIVLATDPENLEFLDPDANKADAVAAVAEYYAVSRSAVLTFGDGENDAPMLRWAGLGVAVDNANEIAKAAAGLVSPGGDPSTAFARAVTAVFDRSANVP